MNINKVLLIGGSGFLGTSVAEQLVANGVAVTVPTRRTIRAKHLWVLPTLQAVEADVHYPDQLAELVCGQDAVINLAGVLHDAKGDFERVHVALPRLIAETCVATGTPRLIQMSALNASMDGPSAYLQSRYRGESAVLEIARKNPSLNVTIFRPSIIFGEHDQFLNMFATLARFSPFIPLGSPEARFQPVWVEDVARAIVQSLAMRETFGQTYALAGPREITLRGLLEFAMHTSGHRRLILPLGPALSMAQAALFERLPGHLITRDNVRSMSVANTSREPFPAMFGRAQSMEAIVPGYMQAGVPDAAGPARYDRFRQRARHTL